MKLKKKKININAILFVCLLTTFILLYNCHSNNFHQPNIQIVHSNNNKSKFVNNFVSKGEQKCRNYLEKRFKLHFNNTRPNFLVNPITKEKLELDCYNPKLKLAVEYNGIQHYRYTPKFHKNYAIFLNQRYRDYIKKQLCKKYNIKLIIVPYWIKDIDNYLDKSLK